MMRLPPSSSASGEPIGRGRVAAREWDAPEYAGGDDDDDEIPEVPEPVPGPGVPRATGFRAARLPPGPSGRSDFNAESSRRSARDLIKGLLAMLLHAPKRAGMDEVEVALLQMRYRAAPVLLGLVLVVLTAGASSVASLVRLSKFYADETGAPAIWFEGVKLTLCFAVGVSFWHARRRVLRIAAGSPRSHIHAAASVHPFELIAVFASSVLVARLVGVIPEAQSSNQGVWAALESWSSQARVVSFSIGLSFLSMPRPVGARAVPVLSLALVVIAMANNGYFAVSPGQALRCILSMSCVMAVTLCLLHSHDQAVRSLISAQLSKRARTLALRWHMLESNLDQIASTVLARERLRSRLRRKGIPRLAGSAGAGRVLAPIEEEPSLRRSGPEAGVLAGEDAAAGATAGTEHVRTAGTSAPTAAGTTRGRTTGHVGQNASSSEPVACSGGAAEASGAVANDQVVDNAPGGPPAAGVLSKADASCVLPGGASRENADAIVPSGHSGLDLAAQFFGRDRSRAAAHHVRAACGGVNAVLDRAFNPWFVEVLEAPVTIALAEVELLSTLLVVVIFFGFADAALQAATLPEKTGAFAIGVTLFVTTWVFVVLRAILCLSGELERVSEEEQCNTLWGGAVRGHAVLMSKVTRLKLLALLPLLLVLVLDDMLLPALQVGSFAAAGVPADADHEVPPWWGFVARAAAHVGGEEIAPVSLAQVSLESLDIDDTAAATTGEIAVAAAFRVASLLMNLHPQRASSVACMTVIVSTAVRVRIVAITAVIYFAAVGVTVMFVWPLEEPNAAFASQNVGSSAVILTALYIAGDCVNLERRRASDALRLLCRELDEQLVAQMLEFEARTANASRV